MTMSTSVFLLLGGLAIVCSVLAFINLAPDQNAHAKVFLKGPFAGKALFTHRGWMYRNLALALAAAAAISLFVLG